MERIELSEVRMKQPVPYNGPSSLTLMRKDSEELYLIPGQGIVVAKRPGKERLLLPLAQTSFCKEYVAPAKVEAPPPAPPEPPAPPKVDVVKFEKNAAGEIREVAKKIAGTLIDEKQK